MVLANSCWNFDEIRKKHTGAPRQFKGFYRYAAQILNLHVWNVLSCCSCCTSTRDGQSYCRTSQNNIVPYSIFNADKYMHHTLLLRCASNTETTHLFVRRIMEDVITTQRPVENREVDWRRRASQQLSPCVVSRQWRHRARCECHILRNALHQRYSAKCN